MRRDCAPHELEPGDYAKRSLTVGDKTFDAWWVCTPNGLIGRLSMPEDNTDRHHHVEEHADGTISVLPQLGNSNSIMVSGGAENKSWHGYIRHGEWEPC